jgi:hypothetical protein
MKRRIIILFLCFLQSLASISLELHAQKKSIIVLTGGRSSMAPERAPLKMPSSWSKEKG